MLLTIKNICLCIVTFLFAVDAEIPNSFESELSIIIKPINDSAFVLSRNQERKNENIIKDLDWILKASTLNTFLEHSRAGKLMDPPLRKRETLSTNHSVTSEKELSNKFLDSHFTVFYSNNSNSSDQALLRQRKQVDENDFIRESAKLQNPSIEKLYNLIPISVLANLRNKTSKAIQEKLKKSDITVPPMPILTRTRENVTNLINNETASTVKNVIFEPNNLNEMVLESDTKQATIATENLFVTDKQTYFQPIITSPTLHTNSSILLDYLTVTDFKELGETKDNAIVLTRENFATKRTVSEESTEKSESIESSKQPDKKFSTSDFSNLNLPNQSYSRFDTSTDGINYKVERYTIEKDSFQNLSEVSKIDTTTTITTTTTTTAEMGSLIRGNDEAHNETALGSGSRSSTTKTLENFIDLKTEYTFENNNGQSTTTATTSLSRTPDLKFAEVKIIPVRAREYTILMTGIILCCIGIVLIIGVLIIFFYHKKKSTSNEVEMISSIHFEEA